LTIYIPETTSRTFKSCYLDVMMHDNQTTAGDDVAAVSIRASCDGGSNWTTCTRTTTVADTGENISFRFFADITAEFVARFTGTSDTLRWGWYVDYASAGGSPVLTNVSCKVVITYEYSDTALDTRIKTVRIPLQGNADTATASLTTTLANLGGVADQIPALDTFCPEASKSYRAIFLEFFTNTNPIAHTTDTEFECKVGSLTADVGAVVEMGQAPQMLIRHTYDCLANSMPTNAVQNVQVRSKTNADAFANVSAILTVTYEYSHDNSTSILNSLWLPAQSAVTGVGSSSVYDDTGLFVTFDAAEPGTLTLAQSGILLITKASGSGIACAYTVKATGQTGTTYYQNKYVSSTDYGAAGLHCLTHRTDNASSSWAVAAGVNRLVIHVSAVGSTASINQLGFGRAIAIINYTSDKASGGEGTHNHSVFLLKADMTRTTVLGEVTSALVVCPETNPTFQGCCTTNIANVSSLTTTSMILLTTGTELALPSAADIVLFFPMSAGNGWSSEVHWTFQGGFIVPRAYSRSSVGIAPIGRFTSDPAVPDCIDPYASRSLQWHESGVTYTASLFVQTYHDITYTVSGTISGYTGDGSGITVDIWNKDEDWLEATTTTTAGGAYTATVRTRDTVYAVARQDDTHCGRSADDVGT
jgi:hypothetical protein